jgi:hypothetical protein
MKIEKDITIFTLALGRNPAWPASPSPRAWPGSGPAASQPTQQRPSQPTPWASRPTRRTPALLNRLDPLSVDPTR